MDGGPALASGRCSTLSSLWSLLLMWPAPRSANVQVCLLCGGSEGAAVDLVRGQALLEPAEKTLSLEL